MYNVLYETERQELFIESHRARLENIKLPSVAGLYCVQCYGNFEISMRFYDFIIC